MKLLCVLIVWLLFPEPNSNHALATLAICIDSSIIYRVKSQKKSKLQAKTPNGDNEVFCDIIEENQPGM